MTALAATQIATLHTTAGDIRIQLFGNHAPKTVKNFVDLATGAKEWTHPGTRQKTNDPLYDGTVFHRVIAGFMIQGGDPLGEGYGGPGYKFADEFHPELSFDRPYLLAMANSGPNTNGSQFFITVGRTPHLNRKHTIFGEVADADSRAVVDAIATTAHRPQRQAGHADHHRLGDGGARRLARPVQPAVTQRCYRHPDREALIRCTRCDRPICPDCMRPASVGFHCPDDVSEGARTVRAPRTAVGARLLQ